MVDFLTKPFQKMPKNNRAKGVALKSPDIKIIMYVCTPLNKVFGFQGFKNFGGQLNLFLNSFPSWTLSQTLSEALKTLWAGSSKLQTPNLAWKVLECKKINKAQMVDFLTKPFPY